MTDERKDVRIAVVGRKADDGKAHARVEITVGEPKGPQGALCIDFLRTEREDGDLDKALAEVGIKFLQRLGEVFMKRGT